MWALYVVGPQLERWLGRTRFIALYVLSALGGSVLVYLLSPINSADGGASGAIFGLFGATFVLARRLNIDVRWVVGLIVINLVIHLRRRRWVQPISWQGHVGGLITGAAIGGGLRLRAAGAPQRSSRPASASRLLVLFAALVWWRTAAC